MKRLRYEIRMPSLSSLHLHLLGFLLPSFVVNQVSTYNFQPLKWGFVGEKQSKPMPQEQALSADNAATKSKVQSLDHSPDVPLLCKKNSPQFARIQEDLLARPTVRSLLCSWRRIWAMALSASKDEIDAISMVRTNSCCTLSLVRYLIAWACEPQDLAAAWRFRE